MKKFKAFILKITRPGPISSLVSLLLIIVIAFTTIIVLTSDYEGSALEPLAYCSFALSAFGFAYVVLVIIFGVPILKKRLTHYLVSHEFTRKLIKDWGFRTILTSSVTFLITIVNSVFNAYLGISERSIWFGALAAYYIFLALMRSGLLIYHRGKRDFESESLIRAKKYTRCGILLLILNAALSSAIAQMIFDDRGFEYKDWLIYAFAAYAFYKIIAGVINAVKARHQADLTLQAIMEINMVDAAVSILALQTALLHTFGDGLTDISLFNTLTGSAVSLFSLTLSIAMIIRGSKIVKEIKNKDGK